MATFIDVINASLERVDESTSNVDSVILDVMKNAVNDGYMLLSSLVDKRTTTVEKDYDTFITLPSDFIDIVRIEHDVLGVLDIKDFEFNGDIVYPLSKDIDGGSLTLTYYQYPQKLTGDNDVLKLKEAYTGSLTAYAAYRYSLHKKKYAAAQLLLQEFNSILPSNPVQMQQSPQ